jgi:hypothetical protein
VLFLVDWAHDFRYGWPGFIGARLLIFGTLLVVIELLLLLPKRTSQASS